MNKVFINRKQQIFFSGLKDFFLNWNSKNIFNIDKIYLTILAIWILEWSMIIEYIFKEWSHQYIFFSIKIPCVLVLIALYWFYLWSIAVWRRAVFGRFTRGERTLWYKGFTAFWVAELVTLVSFVLVYLWMSWGPLPCVTRQFLTARKGVILEFIVYSYLIFLAYVAKINMKWNVFYYQLVISLLIILVLSYLLWRDVLVLYHRDPMLKNNCARWRNTKLNIILYSLSHEWWLSHIIGRRALNFKNTNLVTSLMDGRDPLTNFILLTEYENNLWTNLPSKIEKFNSSLVDLGSIWNAQNFFTELPINEKQIFFYPTRMGYISKRIAMWTFLVLLKMWHQLVILLWWSIYLFRLLQTKQGSYHILSVTYFNIYCCYIIGIFIYIVNYLTIFEFLFKFRVGISTFHRNYIFLEKGLNYLCCGFTTFETQPSTGSLWSLFKN